MLFILSMMFLVVNVSAQTWNCGSPNAADVTATLGSDGVMTVRGTGAMANYSYSTSPWYSVRTSITTLNIEDGVTSIGNYAFCNCVGLSSAILPASVSSIGNSAFQYCEELPSITIPEGIASIGTSAFSACTKLTAVQFNAVNCTSMGSYTNPSFPNTLTSLVIGDNVTRIPDYAFLNAAFTSVTIPDKVTYIGESSFRWSGYFGNTSTIRSVTFGAGVVTIGPYAFGDNDKIASLTIPEGVVTIDRGAFYGCKGLTDLSIPESVKTIGEHAFIECGITSLTIPKGVTYVGDYAFDGCRKLETVYFNAENCTYMGGREGYSKTFTSCIELQTIIIGPSVTRIPENAFYECTRVMSIVIPNSVTEIDDYAFSGCVGLESVTLGDNLASIGRNAFSGCSRVPSLTIPASVTSIGDLAFSDWKGLKLGFVTVQWPDPLPVSDNIFSNVETNYVRLNVPEGTESAYFAADGWKNLYIEGLSPYPRGTVGSNLSWTYDMKGTLAVSGGGAMPDWYYNSNTSTCPWAFLSTDAHTVLLPEGLTYIGSYAFCRFSHLEAITIPSTVSAIGANAFYFTDLLSVTCLRPTPPSAHADAFYAMSVKECDLYVLSGSVAAYRAADVWKSFRIKNYTDIQDINARVGVAYAPESGFAAVSGLRDGEILHFYAVNGRRVLSHTAAGGTEHIPVKHLPSGIYLIEINNGQVLKWIK